MNIEFAAGVGLTALGVAAYAVGVWAPYPGRSLSVTAVMVGITLAAIGRAGRPEGSA